MSETDARRLFHDATAESVLGAPTVDIDAVIGRERRRATRRRIIAAGGAVAAVIAITAAVSTVVSHGPATGDPPATAPAPTPATPAPRATRPEREDFALRALAEHFPGAVRQPVEYAHWDGRVNVEAQVPGPPAATVFVEALRVDASPEHPCYGVRPPTCVELSQPDGSVVTVSHLSEPGSSGVIAIHLRTNGTHVQVGAVAAGSTAPYSDEVMVRAATDPRFTAMAPGTGG